LNVEFNICKDCAVAKARQKDVKQDWNGGSEAPGQRGFLGIRFLVQSVDNYTDYCWSIFLRTKRTLKPKGTDLKIAGINAKSVRCDDSGNN
jgi:hypothetical protein